MYHIEQIYTGCLAQGAYYIVSNGEAAIIDPLRETDPYLERLEKDGVKLKYIFETHFHADFVSGHLDLSRITGAPIIYGPQAQTTFDAIIAEDSQEFSLGDIRLKVLHTPGHTLESTCFLLLDSKGVEQALFSGDTLFLGDVGRPDLAQKSADLTQEDLAGMLYDSLYNKILPLPDHVMIYPAHGAGSACGKNMMKETQDSLGNQKIMNYALNQPSKEAFIMEVCDGLLPPPGYFPMNVALNKKGYQDFNEVKKSGLKAIKAEHFESAVEMSNAIILDTRDSLAFSAQHIPNSINIGIDGSFAPWVGELIIDVKQPLALVCELDRVEEVITRLARVGFDSVIGYLEGGIESWVKEGFNTERVHRISAEELALRYKPDVDQLIDVRKESEYRAEHVENAENKPLSAINQWSSLVANHHFYLHCAGGYRSMIAASILKKQGIHNFTEISGGYAAISKTNIATSDFVCQSKLLH